MRGWIDDLAEGLEVDPLTQTEIDRLLRVAREVAHRVERKGTPLASFLLGMSFARRIGDGSSRADALDDVIARAEILLPPPDDRP